MAENFAVPKYLTTMTFFIGFTMLSTTCTSLVLFPPKDIAGMLRNDTESINSTSTDYGHIVQEFPAAVFNPTSPNDIASLILFSNNNSEAPFGVAARGQGHSVRGQDLAHDGVVINMTALSNGSRIVVSESPSLGSYADVGGEQLWIDVLHATLYHGLTPVSWTDYLYLSVGGTLSNAGISGQTFRFGPQISNVYELDVVTGKGDFITCSSTKKPKLFYAVLGGLGQFGIITRARIALQPAPNRAKWLRLLYSNFSAFSSDQELLISTSGKMERDGFDYVEGLLLMQQGPLDLSFYPVADQPRIASLVNKYGVVYTIEVVKYYDDSTRDTVDKVVENLTKRLSFVPGFMFEQDVSYEEFLDRVRNEEKMLKSLGLWDIAHPWMNLFVPKSRISDFNSGVFKDILLKQKVPAALTLIYPMNRNKWDGRMSAVIPDEDVFYVVGLLHSSGFNEWQAFDEVNKQLLQFCEDAGIMVKQYLPHYETQEDWKNHFGSNWQSFQEMKTKSDPNKILAPGQRIFNSLL
ncbi:PREDICTED: cytokinin dehydrogenase 4-like [Prunus mume]|uniref:cytokinin dehydrogenase n=1 Tax=Prunus mume TaxID=102107 RepID=A0ABM0PP42_PRUMU|nr:PREDICTED: cytokinin dehydrogenase 4-like [Prunus mume]